MRAKDIRPGDIIFYCSGGAVTVLEGEPYIYESRHDVAISMHRGQWHVPADYLSHTQHVCVALARNGALRSDIAIKRDGKMIHEGSTFRSLRKQVTP